ncbi:MAG: hypothetical protein ACW976_03175 [Candidatus Ranarchaeia archaeon]
MPTNVNKYLGEIASSLENLTFILTVIALNDKTPAVRKILQQYIAIALENIK